MSRCAPVRRLTVVLERRPPSPSIQTSGKVYSESFCTQHRLILRDTHIRPGFFHPEEGQGRVPRGPDGRASLEIVEEGEGGDGSRSRSGGPFRRGSRTSLRLFISGPPAYRQYLSLGALISPIAPESCPSPCLSTAVLQPDATIEHPARKTASLLIFLNASHSVH